MAAILAWTNTFTGSTLHAIFGYSTDIISDESTNPYLYSWMNAVTKPAVQPFGQSLTAYAAYVKGTEETDLHNWAVIDKTTTHGDFLSTAPNPNVYPNDTDGSLQQWGNTWLTLPSTPAPTPLSAEPVLSNVGSIMPGTPIRRYYLRPEVFPDAQFIAQFPWIAPYVHRVGTVTSISSPLGSAELHNVTGGLSAIHQPSGRVASFSESTAYNTALDWVNRAGRLPTDAVLQGVITQTHQLIAAPDRWHRLVPIQSPVTILGYTFIWKHAGPFQGSDGIAVSVDDEMHFVAGGAGCNPNPKGHIYARAALPCPGGHTVEKPGVYYYYRLWRTPVLVSPVRLRAAASPAQRFGFTLSAQDVLKRIGGRTGARPGIPASGQATAAITGEGLTYWTPRFNDDNPSDQYAEPAQYFDINGQVRVYFDLSGNELGEFAK